MPAYYDIPLQGNGAFANFASEDVNKFQKLQYYLTKNEVKRSPLYKTWEPLYGNIKWQPNMGTTMRGVRPEYSPIGDSFVYPVAITSAPNRNIFETLESIEEAVLKLQRFESKQIHFLPSFQDFRENQLQWTHDDIVRQETMYSERFLRTFVWHYAPNIMIAGNNGASSNLGPSELVQGCPAAQPANPTAAAGKTTAFLQDVAAAVGQSLTLKVVYKACQYLDDDLGAMPFEGTNNTPRDNELVKGKYVLITGTDAWRQFTWDTSVAGLKALDLNLLFDGFKGSLFGMVTTKCEKWPLRMNSDGVFIAPQVIDQQTNKTRPNPLYTRLDSAPYEWAFLCASEALKSIQTGAPPREFASKSMSAEKFYSLRWNGEIQLTDQLLVKYVDGSVDLNRYGTHLQFISQMIMGVIAGEINNIIPICFLRSRISTV